MHSEHCSLHLTRQSLCHFLCQYAQAGHHPRNVCLLTTSSGCASCLLIRACAHQVLGDTEAQWFIKTIHDSLWQLNSLHNTKTSVMQAVKDKFGCMPHQLRAYVHYHPSYYHFHVHIMHINVDFGPGMAAGKAHLLDDIIGESHTCWNFGESCA